MTGFNLISPAQLIRLIGTQDAPVVIDVRTDEDFARDPRLIPTALRVRGAEILSLLPRIGSAGRKA